MIDKIIYFLAIILFLCFFWLSIKMTALFLAKKILNKEKENLQKLLTKRHNLVPILIAMSEKFAEKNEKEREELIYTRAFAIKETDFNAEKIIIENELSQKIKEYIEIYKFLKNGLFLEIVYRIQDLSDLIENESSLYSKLVMDFNKELNKGFIMVSAKILKIKRENIFDFEK